MLKRSLMVVAILGLTACGHNGERVSESDLEKALAQSARSGAVCAPFALDISTKLDEQAQQMGFSSALGSEELRILKRTPLGKRANEQAVEQMEILVDAGIYDDVGVTKSGEGEHMQRFYTYRLTEKGRQSFLASPHGALLCIGKWDVQKINYYTEPTPANGVTMTQVSYEAKIKPERWAKKLLKNSPYFEGLKQTETRKITLVQTNQGWRDIFSLR